MVANISIFSLYNAHNAAAKYFPLFVKLGWRRKQGLTELYSSKCVQYHQGLIEVLQRVLRAIFKLLQL
jgi:hypothetical protein